MQGAAQTVLVLLAVYAPAWLDASHTGILYLSPKPVDDQSVINFVNNRTRTTWRAGRTTFHGRSHAEKSSFAAHVTPHTPPPRTLSVCTGKTSSTKLGDRQAVSFPASFDARTQWSQCSEIISDIRSQGQCGSCWANSAASVFSDRLCIHRGLTTKISVQDLVSCMPADYKDSATEDMCNGGDYLTHANRMFVFQGAVTGGEFGAKTNIGCYPYTGESFTNGKSPACSTSCSNSDYNLQYSMDKISAVNAVFMGYNTSAWGMNANNTYFYNKQGVIEESNEPAADVESLIKNELMTYGPVSASLNVYNDFFSYTSGVYQLTNAPNNAFQGGHAIKIIGWGVAVDGTPFWQCVNSWGTSWGENGMFKILRGRNHLAIEGYVVGTRLEEITAASAN